MHFKLLCSIYVALRSKILIYTLFFSSNKFTHLPAFLYHLYSDNYEYFRTQFKLSRNISQTKSVPV